MNKQNLFLIMLVAVLSFGLPIVESNMSHYSGTVNIQSQLPNRINTETMIQPSIKLTFERNTKTSVTLYWEPVRGNTFLKEYTVLKNNIPIGNTSTTFFKDEMIKVGETYDYKVVAYDVNKNYSSYSNTVSINSTK